MKQDAELAPLLFSSTNMEQYNQQFTVAELQSSLKFFPRNKVLGSDNIPVLFLIQLSGKLKKILLLIYNIIWIAETFPFTLIHWQLSYLS